MSSASDEIARSAAQRLSAEFGVNLPGNVEAQLQTAEPPKRFEPVTIAISLAALLVAASKAAWDVYQDVKTTSKTPPATAVVERQLRIELKIDNNISTEQRDKIITVVVDEVAKAAPTA